MTFEEYLENKFLGHVDEVPEEIINLLRKIYNEMEAAQSRRDYGKCRDLSNKLESYISQIKPQLGIDDNTEKSSCK